METTENFKKVRNGQNVSDDFVRHLMKYMKILVSEKQCSSAINGGQTDEL